METILVAVIVLLVVSVALLVRLILYWPAMARARRAGVDVTFGRVIGMWFRKVNAVKVLRCCERLKNAGIDVPVDNVEVHFLAGGDVERTTQAMILADEYGQELEWNAACAIDLAGRDVVEEVQATQREETIDIPLPEDEADMMNVWTRDGWQLRWKGRATVKRNIQRLVGGATEQTIAARIAGYLMEQMAGYEQQEAIFADRRALEASVLNANLDAGCALDLVGFEITHMELGDRIEDRIGGK